MVKRRREAKPASAVVADEEDADPFIGLDWPTASSAIRVLDVPVSEVEERSQQPSGASVHHEDMGRPAKHAENGSERSEESGEVDGDSDSCAEAAAASATDGDRQDGEPAARDAPPAEARSTGPRSAAPVASLGVTDESELPPWMRSANARIIGEHTPPIRALALDPRLEAAVLRMGVRRCFPVQATVVPIVLASAAAGAAGDICCCAPTGSGKTLAYALPILEHLLSCSAVCRLRALILLPTRGLATQVFGVLTSLCEQLPLRVGLAVGMDGASWEEERQALLGRSTAPVASGVASGGGVGRVLASGRSAVDVLVATPGRLVEHVRAGGGFTLQHLRWLVIDEADRLLMHGFQSWLPILLDAAYAQPTLNATVESSRPEPPAVSQPSPAGVGSAPFPAEGATGAGAWSGPHAGDALRGWCPAELTRRPLVGTVTASARGGPLAFARCFGAAAAGGGEGGGAGLPGGSAVASEALTKLLFSATLTRSAAMLAPLRLESAAYFCVSGARYATPATLREWMLSCPAQDKPLLLLLLLRWIEAQPKAAAGYWKGRAARSPVGGRDGAPASPGGSGSEVEAEETVTNEDDGQGVGSMSASGADSDGDSVGGGGETGAGRDSEVASGGPSCVLVFTSSVEATHRLSRLLQLLGLPAAEYSSAVPAAQRHATLGALRAGGAGIVVASDAMARGIDADTIGTVINYDAPTNIRAYLHRVGRTARAGRKGTSFTMLSDSEARPFKQMMAKAGKEWRAFRLPQEAVASAELRPSVDLALGALANVLAQDARRGRRAAVAPVPALGPVALRPADPSLGAGERLGVGEVAWADGEGSDEAGIQCGASALAAASAVDLGESGAGANRDGVAGGTAAGEAASGAAGGRRPAHIVAHSPDGWEEVEWQRVLQAQRLERVAAARRTQAGAAP